MKIEIGKKYLVKSWEEMEKEYGLDECGYINVPAAFVPSMRRFCKTIVTIKSRGNSLGDLWYDIIEDNGEFFWSKEMLKEIPDKRTIKFYLEKRIKNG